MSSIVVNKSNEKNVHKAFEQSTKNIDTSSKLILFFASTIYPYNEIVQLFCVKYPKAEVVGLTTVGEINNNGIEEQSLTVAAFSGSDLKVKAVFMERIHKYPVFQRDELMAAAKEVGINPKAKNPEKEGFALVFPNGLINAEERLLSIVNSLFHHEGFHVFGGTAGDDAKFEHTYTSLNERIASDAGVVIFVKLDDDFKVYKESIFKAYSNDVLVATKVDVEGRKVYEFNGRPAAAEYARILGVTSTKLNSLFMAHPLGFVGKQLSVGSPMCVNRDQSISFYCQISKNAELKVLQPIDVLSTMDATVQQLEQDFSQIKGTLAINCILRKIQFKETNLIAKVNERFRRMPNAFGFCSYGEQIQNEQINQTLVLLVIGKRKGTV